MSFQTRVLPRMRAAGSLLILLCLVACAMSADAPPRPQVQKGGAAGSQSVTANKLSPEDLMSRNSDQAIATWLAIENQEEISIGKIAESKAQRQEVREYAAMMVKDHGTALEELSRFGAPLVSLDP